MNTIRTAFIGCGAVVERSHLPAIANSPNFTVSALVDRNHQQLLHLGEQYNVSSQSDDFRTVIDQFDLAVIATPSASHASLGKELLQAGKHVLMEKPLATSASDAKQLHSLAESKQLLLAVSLVRRYLPHFQLVKQILDVELLGEVREFTLEEGGVFNWPVQSVDFYQAERSGGGVLMDHGAHLLDACLWWFGDYKAVDYADDSRGGVEADCELQLTMTNGAKGLVRMSRVRALKNRLQVNGSKAKLDLELATGRISLEPHAGKSSAALSLFGEAASLVGKPEVNRPDTLELFAQQYEAIANCLAQKSNSGQNMIVESFDANLAIAADSLRSVELIEHCYRQRNPQPLVAW